MRPPGAAREESGHPLCYNMSTDTPKEPSAAARLENAAAKLAEARAELELAASDATAKRHCSSAPRHLRTLCGIEDYCRNLRALVPDPATAAAPPKP